MHGSHNSHRSLQGLKGFEKFANLTGLAEEERRARRSLLERSFMPFRVTEYFTDLIMQQDEPYRSQLLNIVLPPPGEGKYVGRFDPYGNVLCRQGNTAFLQHKYRNTLLLHICDHCIANCQFCYKVHEIRHEDIHMPDLSKKINIAGEYLGAHPEIDNVLFTGGDPVSFLSTDQLISAIASLFRHQGIRTVRLATKGLAFNPLRFLDDKLLAFFDEVRQNPKKQITVIAQFNHPAEINEPTIQAIRALQAVGVQLRGQPAIIKGVNDEVSVLTELQQAFLNNGIISYYLTVFMPVRGVEQYGMTLDEVFRITAESKRNLNGLAKKGILLAAHDFGKFEIVGFVPTPEDPREIILKWHQAADARYLPSSLRSKIPTRPEDVLVLSYQRDTIFGIDHVFAHNALPHFNHDGKLVE